LVKKSKTRKTTKKLVKNSKKAKNKSIIKNKRSVKVLKKAPNKKLKSSVGVKQKTVAKATKRPIEKPEEPKINREELTKKLQQIEREEISRLNSVLQDSYARQLLIDLAGENSLEIVRNFRGNPSDEDIAKKLKIKISDVRATLNKLHSAGLVNYFRDKDNETGWYSYSWNLNRSKIQNWVEESIQDKHKEFLESGDHYFCVECGLESIKPFESATEVKFKCHSCDKDLEFLDVEKLNELIKLKKQ